MPGWRAAAALTTVPKKRIDYEYSALATYTRRAATVEINMSLADRVDRDRHVGSGGAGGITGGLAFVRARRGSACGAAERLVEERAVALRLVCGPRPGGAAGVECEVPLVEVSLHEGRVQPARVRVRD